MGVRGIKNGFKRMGGAELNSFTSTVISSIDGNPHFPNPVPTVAQLKACFEEFKKSMTDAADGGRTAIAIKNQKKDALANHLVMLSMYVSFVAKGNVAIMRSSGLRLHKEPETLVLDKVKSFKVMNGVNPGEMICSIKVKNARSFLYQYTEDPMTADSIWISEGSSCKKWKFSNLTSGKKYWFRVKCIGSNGQTIYTDPVSKIVL